MAGLTVGVLGGMGPDATLDFFAKLLAATPAVRDQDRLRVIIDNNPAVPDRNEAVAGRGPSPGPVLAAMARGLEGAGAQMLVMPCNAAHAFVSDIRAEVTIPFVDMIEATVARTMSLHPTVEKVGVLAAAGCLDARLYEKAFERQGLQAIAPTGSGRQRFMDLLYRIKSGERGAQMREPMVALALELTAAGAQAIVAGCTEVPLVLSGEDLPVPLVNSTDALVETTVTYASAGGPPTFRRNASVG